MLFPRTISEIGPKNDKFIDCLKKQHGAPGIFLFKYIMPFPRAESKIGPKNGKMYRTNIGGKTVPKLASEAGYTPRIAR